MTKARPLSKGEEGEDVVGYADYKEKQSEDDKKCNSCSLMIGPAFVAFSSIDKRIDAYGTPPGTNMFTSSSFEAGKHESSLRRGLSSELS